MTYIHHERSRARAFADIADFDATTASYIIYRAFALHYVYMVCYVYTGLPFSYRKSHVCALSVTPDIIIIIYYRRLVCTDERDAAPRLYKMYIYVCILYTLYILSHYIYIMHADCIPIYTCVADLD